MVEETEAVTEGTYLPNGKERKEVPSSKVVECARRRSLSTAFGQIQLVLASPPGCNLRMGKGWVLDRVVAKHPNRYGIGEPEEAGIGSPFSL